MFILRLLGGIEEWSQNCGTIRQLPHTLRLFPGLCIFLFLSLPVFLCKDSSHVYFMAYKHLIPLDLEEYEEWSYVWDHSTPTSIHSTMPIYIPTIHTEYVHIC
jgi:hypothetical protein